VFTGVLGVGLEPLAGLLGTASRGFTQVLRRHAWGVIVVTLLYAVLFMYFQQTLLIDGLSYTSSGPFRLHLLPGQWIIVSTTPPTPNMPFPLWGSPFISLTTNFFDVAFTPLSLGITLVESFLVSAVIYLYLDIYASVKKGFASKSSLGLAQTLTLLTIFLSCSCEFFEGVLAAVEPAAGIISTTLPSLLPVVDETFLIFSLTILVTSIVFLSTRITGVDVTKMLPTEYLWFTLFTFPFTIFILLEGNLRLSGIILLILSASIISSKATHNRNLLVYPAPFLAYVALSGITQQAGLSPDKGIALSLSILLGVVLSIRTKLKRSGVAALLLASALSVLVNPLLVAVPISILLTSILTGNMSTSLNHYVLYQAVSWAPIMLGPVAIAYRPVPPLPYLSIQAQVALYVYLWLLSTPLSWYLGIKAIFTLMNRAGVTTVEVEEEDVRPVYNISEDMVYTTVGLLAIISQISFYLAEPQVFLVSSYNTQTRSLLITSTSLIITLIGLTLLFVGVRRMVLNRRMHSLSGLALVLSDKSKMRVYWATLLGYLAFSLLSIGTFAWGGQAPPGLPTPSVGVFPSGPLLYAPSVTVYLTRGFGVVLVPEHIIVAVITSILVATSYKALALIATAPVKAKRAGLLGGAPAVVLSCPTCTATSIYSLLGLNSAISGAGILAAPFLGTIILAAAWVGLLVTIVYASKKIDSFTKPRIAPPTSNAEPLRPPS